MKACCLPVVGPKLRRKLKVVVGSKEVVALVAVGQASVLLPQQILLPGHLVQACKDLHAPAAPFLGSLHAASAGPLPAAHSMHPGSMPQLIAGLTMCISKACCCMQPRSVPGTGPHRALLYLLRVAAPAIPTAAPSSVCM